MRRREQKLPHRYRISPYVVLHTTGRLARMRRFQDTAPGREDP